MLSGDGRGVAKPSVLYVCHNHPSLFPGGAEVYALDLYHAMRDAGEFEPILLARIGPTVATTPTARPGTPFSMVGRDPRQYFFFTETAHFDFFYLTSRDKDVYTVHLDGFLRAYRPDVVHIQHMLFLGYDVIRQVRNTLPRTPIVHTLHEYLPICHRDGQMVRTRERGLCDAASPRRCHDCFPEVSPQQFFLRTRFIQSHLSLVDLFVAPSRFLLERYVDWGIPRERIVCEDYGRPAVPAPVQCDESRPRTRLGFFGQLNPYKGVLVLLRAMELLEERGGAPRPHLWIHGANLELQTDAFQDRVRALLARSAVNVTFAGPYDRTALGGLMANIDWVVVPSTWWENSPLVIQEAFMHGRPVICSDIGGMAEKVTHGLDGLHFRSGDAASLAEVIDRAVRSPGLWDALHAKIRPVHSMEDHVTNLTRAYRALLERPAPGCHATAG